MKNLSLLLLFLINQIGAVAQVDSLTILHPQPVVKKWYDSFAIRGYSQIRYNRLLETNPDLGCEQCDKSWGENGGFFMRRMRIIFYGQVNPRIYFYVQPDFASAPSSSSLNFAQIRDAYFDVALSRDNTFRLRIGQSKIPFGFENLQSSQNRLPLDRNDALNSAVSNERDMGIFFNWTPIKIKERYSSLVKQGFKGSGDYGIFAFGLYNGQTANKPDLNNSPHAVMRLSYPFAIKNQVIEPGLQAYTGKYVVAASQMSEGVGHLPSLNYIDQRVAASFIIYPKPFGLQVEYNIGRGPEFNKVTDSIEVMPLSGGYATLNYKIDFKGQKLYPFLRYQYYDGGKKHERDARSYEVRELEIGMEWEPVKNFELVVMYTMSQRRYEDFIMRDNFQTGRLLRIQAQVNF